MFNPIFNIIADYRHKRAFAQNRWPDVSAGAVTMILRPSQRFMRRILVLGTLVAAAGCAPKIQYDVPAFVEIAPGSRETARDANAMLDQWSASRGDLNPNDLIRLTYPYFPALNVDQRVQMSGFISPPLLDPIQTNGRTIAELQADMTAKYRSKLERPAVSLAVLEYDRPPPPPEIFVMGEVAQGGALPYREGTTLIETIARAGGGSARADLQRVVVLTPGANRFQARMVDLDGMLNGRPAELAYLPAYSIIIVPSTRLSRLSDRSSQIREIIGFNGINIGSNLDILNP